MRRFIHIRTMWMSVIAVLACALLCSAAYYQVFYREVLTDLAAYTRLLGERIPLEDDADFAAIADEVAEAGIRLTVISEEGKVAFDNTTDAAELGNHLDRSEIRAALAEGEGSSTRRSSTGGGMTLYYAVLLEDGSVLRTARDTRSFYGIFFHALPVVLISCAIMLWVCYFFSRALTRDLLRPIRDFSEHMDEPGQVQMYAELEPIIEHMQRQHAVILESAKQRQEFTANVSHELKTPLTVISGYTQLLENGMADPAQRDHFVHEIGKNADRLLTLINDILRLSELDTASEDGRASGKMASLDLYEAAERCVGMLEPVSAEYQVQMCLEGEPSLVTADTEMVDELLFNLCDNAIRYNRPGGHVTVTVGEGCISVRDDGIGIPAKYQDRIFERFFRVDKSRSKKTGGTGLGLAIVKHIVELHHARLEVRSELEKGTTISVFFT